MSRLSALSKLVISTAIVIATFAVALLECRAGMPSFLPNDVATYLSLDEEPKQRLQVISFFLVTFLLSGFVVKLLWNGLRGEFLSLPEITYLKALMVTFCWGLLFSLVLVMISGARELMTPGAWEKNGTTYRLKGAEPEKETYEP